MTVPRPIIFVLCTLPWVAMLACLAWFVSVRYPAAVFTAEGHFDGKSAWANPFLPAERATKPGPQEDGWTGQRVTGDPVYFTARVPGLYEEVDVELEFRPVRQPLIEFGMVHDAAGKELELRPLFAEGLMGEEWRAASVDGVMGYVRDGVDPKRLAGSDPRGMAVWYASSSYPMLIDAPVATPTVHEVSLRGSHDLYVVPTTDGIKLTFTLQPANRNLKNDIVSFRVFRGEEEVSRESFGVTGSRETRMGKAVEHTVEVKVAAPGVYRIAFAAEDDVFIRGIEANVRRLVIGPRFVLGDTAGYLPEPAPVAVWTNSRHLVAETFHADALQPVTLASTTVRLREAHTPYRLDRKGTAGDLARLYVPKGNVRFVGDGFFALSPEAFFEPRPRRMGDTTVLLEEGIEAVRTPFLRPEPLGDGWYRAHLRFDVDPGRPTMRFVLSAPGIASRAAAVDLRAVRLSYVRTPAYGLDWFRLIARELVHALRRL